MVRKPKRVRVGAFTYRIAWEESDSLTAHGADGLFEAGKQLITVNPTQGRDMRRVHLLHEILHACVHDAGNEDHVTDEETAVQAITARLLQTLRDNPIVTRWLLSLSDSRAYDDGDEET